MRTQQAGACDIRRLFIRFVEKDVEPHFISPASGIAADTGQEDKACRRMSGQPARMPKKTMKKKIR
jgi:hypothetical protein